MTKEDYIQYRLERAYEVELLINKIKSEIIRW